MTGDFFQMTVFCIYPNHNVMQTMYDHTLLDKLKTEESSSFQLLYKNYYPSILSFVRQNNGNDDDAKDIFQESVIALLQKVRQPGFVLTSSLKTYLYTVARNLWLKRLRDNKMVSVDTSVLIDSYHQQFGTVAIEVSQEESKEQKIKTWLERITIHCQRVIKALFFYQEPMESLMLRMGWKNKHTAANQKYKCLEQVKNEHRKDQGA